MSLTHMLFSAQGRIRRRDYWLWSIVTFVAYIAIYVGVAIATGSLDKMGSDDEPLSMLLTQLALAVPSTWVSVCITSKRWHDRDKSGWMYLVLFIPLVGVIWTFIECGILDGTPGSNKYGRSPKATNAPETVF